jgi:potassium efflux system protein
LGTGIFKQPLYLLLILGVFAFIRVRPIVRRRLRATAEHVDHYSGDTFSSTLLALAYSLALAFTWPVATWSVGFVIESLCGDIKLGNAIGTAFMRISYFYFGMEAFRQLLRPSGLVIGHFGWDAKTCRRLSVGLRSLERVFLPSVLLGIIPARLHPIEGGSVLSMLCLIVALVAVARFFYQVPSFMQQRFDEIMHQRTVKRPPIWGRLVRWALILIPCGLIICMLLGYGNTAISFLVLLLYTNALIASLLVLQEMGARWFKLVRRRMVAAERAAEWAAQREKALEGGEENPDADEVFDEDFGELETESLDDEARKLLAGILTLTALVGVVAIWGDVLPALGILDSVELWNRSETVDGELQTVPVTLAGIGFALVVILVGVVLVRRVPNVLEILLRQKLSVSHGSVYAATTLFRYTLIAIIVTVVAGSLGGSWSSIQWAVAALSVGIGFGLQEIVANFISGLILLFEQPIRVGDTVTVGETSGVVTKIRMRATTIRDWNRRELLVPNKEFITGRLLNWSLSDQLTAYGSDLKLAMDLAVEAGRSHPEVLDDPAPFVTFDDFGDNSLKLVLRCFMDSVDNRLTASSAVRLEVDKRFKEAGIVIAFPQRDVHLDTSAPLDITLRNAT